MTLTDRAREMEIAEIEQRLRSLKTYPNKTTNSARCIKTYEAEVERRKQAK